MIEKDDAWAESHCVGIFEINAYIYIHSPKIEKREKQTSRHQ